MTQRIRVLLVDDEKPFVKNLSRLLKVRGFEVACAHNGYEALDLVKYGGGFDVVLLDIKMPGMDGISTLGKIKKWAPDTEVIMLTGHGSLATGTEAMRKGAYDYLMKPCDIEDLTEKIREAHEAEEIRRHPVLWTRKMVRDISLSDVPRLQADATLLDAMEKMNRPPGEQTVEEVYVVDPEDRLLGVVARRDLLHQVLEEKRPSDVTWAGLLQNPQWLPHREVKEIMRQDPVTTQSNAYLTDAANQMFMNNARQLPVLRAGKIIGMITMADVFRYLEGEME